MKTITKKFDNLAALAAFINNAPLAGYFADKTPASVEGSQHFTGTASLEEANKLMRDGWNEGAERVQKIMLNNSAMGVAPKAQRYYHIAGFAPAVGRYLANNPRCMIAKKKVKAPAPVVSIVYNCTVPANVRAGSLESAAAKLFNVIAALESHGTRVNLWVAEFSAAEGNAEQSAILCRIKDSGQPFNLLKMIYPAVHPSFFRRQIFAVQERAGLTADWHGYGHCVTGADAVKLAKAAGVHGAVIGFNELKDADESAITEKILKGA